MRVRSKKYVVGWPAAIGLCLSAATLAQGQEPPKHGTLRGDLVSAPSFEFGLCSVVQHAVSSDIDDDATLSGDLVARSMVGRGELLLYVEGATTVRDERVSSVLPGANADAGTAFSGDGEGRIQVSELHYSLAEGEGRALTFGLLDPTGFLDSSEVANDETSQFLAASLVNNPTIDFPDYTLGAAFSDVLSDDAGYTLLLSSSHGLGNNDQPYYDELFDLGAKGKGVFAALELFRRHGETVFRFGGWTNTAAHAYVDGTGKTAYNYGAYGVLDGKALRFNWNLRAGLANADVSTVKGFLAGAVEYPLAPVTVGLGLVYGRVNLTDRPGESDDALQAEIYARYEFSRGLHVTPSVQWLDKGGPTSADSSLADVTVLGLRLAWSY